MIASLMMYTRPEVQGAYDRYWASIRQRLAARGIDAPEKMANGVPECDVWAAPDLVLSQTCGMPYRTRLHPYVTLVGTPDFDVEGCAPGYYRSAIVVRADDTRRTLAAFRDARFAYNATSSQSGFASIYHAAADQGFWFHDRRESRSHQGAARAVALGRADIAALDAVTWRMIQQYDGFAAGLRVLDWTDPTPGLPYIAAAGADRTGTFAAVAEAVERLAEADRIALGIRDLVEISKAAYLAIPNPPPEAN